MTTYLDQLLARYVGLVAAPGDTVLNVGSTGTDLTTVGPWRAAREPGEGHPIDADHVLLNGTLHYERDIDACLSRLRAAMRDESRLIVTYYSALWRPLIALATALGIRRRTPEQNWLTHGDIRNFVRLADFEVVRTEQKVLFPVRIPLLSGLVNRFLAPLPLFSSLCLVNVLVARPRPRPMPAERRPSVSIVVPARNEAGNIDAIVDRLPAMGPEDELIFVEGGSSDDTWRRIQRLEGVHDGRLRIRIAQQEGTGKGDAVRKGFAMARNEVLMILDADLSVPPEDLPKFYAALVSGKGEFINGSRLVYPMERRAMRFLNLLGNKFFAMAFSFVLAQDVKDTLCGTKALMRARYERLAAERAYFGEFDPFGDFDLLFGAARMGLAIVEVPITYRERTYGETNISRWRHGALLFAMLAFGARRLKFV